LLQREWSWRWGGLPVQDPETWDESQPPSPTKGDQVPPAKEAVMTVNEKIDSYLKGLPEVPVAEPDHPAQGLPVAPTAATQTSLAPVQSSPGLPPIASPPFVGPTPDLLTSGLVHARQTPTTPSLVPPNLIEMSLCGQKAIKQAKPDVCFTPDFFSRTP
jgi:hypothetical protein